MSKHRIEQISFRYTPMSDYTIVQWLINNRFTVSSYALSGPFNEDILLTYIDLDRIIQKTDLSYNESMTVRMIMDGYKISDIAQINGKDRHSYDIFRRRAITKICDMAVKLWSTFYGDRPANGFCY